MSQTFGNSMPDPATADVRQRSVRMSSRMRPIASSTSDADAELDAIPVPVVSFPRIQRAGAEQPPTDPSSANDGSMSSVSPDVLAPRTTSQVAAVVTRQEEGTRQDRHPEYSAGGTSGVMNRSPVVVAAPANAATIGQTGNSELSSSLLAPAASPGEELPQVAHDPREFDPLSGIVTAARKAAKKADRQESQVDYGLPADHNDYATNLSSANLSSAELAPTINSVTQHSNELESRPSVEDLADAVWLKRQKLIYEVLFQITLTAILITILLVVHAWLTGKLFAPPSSAPPPAHSPAQVDGRLHDPLTSSSTPPATFPATGVAPTMKSSGDVHREFPVHQTDHERVENAGLRLPDLPH